MTTRLFERTSTSDTPGTASSQCATVPGFSFMRHPFKKPPLSLKDQVDHLLSKGMCCDSPNEVKCCLEKTGYYRFKTYVQAFFDDKQQLRPNTHIYDIINLMDFDHDLRLLSLEALCKLEVVIRIKINEYLSEITKDPFWYLNRLHFRCAEKHIALLDSMEKERQRSREGFIKSYNDAYLHPQFESADWIRDYPDLPPSWMVIELCSFGTISHLYSNLHPDHASELSGYFGVNKKILAKWLWTLSHLRNACAHHARLWNATLSIIPPIPRNVTPPFPVELRKDRYGMAAAIIHFLTSRFFPTNSWTPRLRQHLASCPDWYLDSMGLPLGWYDDPFWR